jgi:hypothetical protein
LKTKFIIGFTTLELSDPQKNKSEIKESRVSPTHTAFGVTRIGCDSFDTEFSELSDRCPP